MQKALGSYEGAQGFLLTLRCSICVWLAGLWTVPEEIKPKIEAVLHKYCWSYKTLSQRVAQPKTRNLSLEGNGLRAREAFSSRIRNEVKIERSSIFASLLEGGLFLSKVSIFHHAWIVFVSQNRF
jgi:hypothetical protein